jgi:hypothetical protein
MKSSKQIVVKLQYSEIMYIEFIRKPINGNAPYGIAFPSMMTHQKLIQKGENSKVENK